MHDFILSGDPGGIFFLIIVIIGIVSSVMKSAKEKKEREERARRMEGSSGSSKPKTQQRSGPSSIEDFLRELSGGGATQQREKPKPQPVQRKDPEWRAPQGGIADFLKQAEAQKKREEQEQRRKRAEKQKRKEEKKRRENEKRQKELQRQKRKARSSSSDPHVKDVHADAYERPRAVSVSLNFSRMKPSDLRKAFVLKEILGPPVALKETSDSEYPLI